MAQKIACITNNESVALLRETVLYIGPVSVAYLLRRSQSSEVDQQRVSRCLWREWASS